MSQLPQYGEIESTNGLQKLVTYTWVPEGDPIGVVQVVHGMREHMGRYNDFANFLAKNGYIVWGHDQIGHGRTVLAYGEYGYFGEKHGAKILVDDANKLTKQLVATYKDLPIFLLGHSMGSFIARLQVLSTSPLLDGFICIGSGGVNPFSAYLRAYAGVISTTKGGSTTSIMIKSLMDSAVFHQRLAANETGDAWISHDPEVVREFVDDPLTNFQFTNQGYCDLLDLQIASNRDQWYQRIDSLLPMFLLSGGDDPVGVFGKDIPKIYAKLLDDSYMVDVSQKIYEHMRHEILNEFNNSIVYNDILNWVNERNQHHISKGDK